MYNNTKKFTDQKRTTKVNPIIYLFEDASPEEQKKVFDKVIKGANEDQRKVLREYDKKFPK